MGVHKYIFRGRIPDKLYYVHADRYSEFINRWVYTSTYSEEGSLTNFTMFMLTGIVNL